MERTARWLKDRLGYEFRQPALLDEALTHRSASARNNERLEFLGDAVLDCVISDMLFVRRSRASEGELSRLRASLVKDSTLAELADSLGLGDHLVLGVGEKKSGGHRRPSILAGALEAIFGAIYLDAGFDAADRVIRQVYAELTETLPAATELKDPKTQLQELLQGGGLSLPEYELASVSGEAHRQVFEVTCRVAGEERATHGRGATRRDAEQEAAARMLDRLGAG